MFSKYHYVYEVYKERNITKAAEKLFISQPSLSVAIKNIEKKLGADLFERRGNTVLPTNVGMEYILTAEKIMALEKEFQNRLNDMNNLQTGKLTVGGTNYLSSFVLPRVINTFTKRYPNVEVELQEANSMMLGSMIQNDEIDVIVDSFDGTPIEYESFFLASEEILLCVPKDRPINKLLTEYQIEPEEIYKGTIDLKTAKAVSPKVFEKESFVLLKKGNDMYMRAMRIFEENSMEVKVAYKVDQLNISYALANSGIGLCFVTDTFFKYGRFHDNVFLYKFSNEKYSRNLYVAYRKNKYCTKAMKAFVEIAKALLAQKNTNGGIQQ